MKSFIKNIIALTLILINCHTVETVYGQEILQIDPIFEYPVAPEELESLTDKSDYLVKCFWDQLDTKSTATLNQIALNDAFRVYLTPLRYASEKAATESIDKLISRISGNPTLLVQFAKAVEENLYGPRAEIWSDELYLKFLDAAVKNKKVSKSRKEKYIKRANLLRTTAPGASAPSFWFEEPGGKNSQYYPMSTPTIIIFGDPQDTDWRLARLKMDSNSALTQAIDKGKLNVMFISLNEEEGWKNAVSNYSKKWAVGFSRDIFDIYDIRVEPAIYLIGTDGKIIYKNAPIDLTLNKALEIVG